MKVEQAEWLTEIAKQVDRVLNARSGLVIFSVDAPAGALGETVKVSFQAFGQDWSLELRGPLHRYFEEPPNDSWVLHPQIQAHFPKGVG